MYKAERSVDRISTLPQPILETILCLLSTEEAARISILSREWRYKWTTIPNLRFELRNTTSELTSDIASTRKKMDMNDLHQLILHLSRNHTVKKLTLTGLYELEYIWYKLPVSVFSLHHLTDLSLGEFDLDHPPTFEGFGSLGSLYLNDVKISTKSLLHLLSNCPSLKCFGLDIGELDGECTINELLKSQWLVLDPVPQELPTSLIHLKYLRLEGMCIDEDCRLAFHVLIKCSPNLERFELDVNNVGDILLLRQGPIYELTLQLSEDKDACLELDQIVSHLSRNYTVKKLTLCGWYNDYGYEVPISIFSFHHLRDLVISKVIPTKTLLHLLLNCPSLKNLSLDIWESGYKCTINELLKCLPAIEHLTTWPHISEWVVLDSVSQELPTSLIHLRYLCFKDMTLLERCRLAFLLFFIKCSPNLEKVKLEVNNIIIFHVFDYHMPKYADTNSSGYL
ncbi:putative leucine-rich repeat domain superfamily, F-box-like domain superfamily [Helianthus debilis subsp. tardiflorus]